MFRWPILSLFSVSLLCISSLQAQSLDLTQAVVVIRSGDLPPAEKVAPTILTEEIASRTGVTWKVVSEWPEKANTIIAISTLKDPPAWKDRIAGSIGSVPQKAEAFAVQVTPATTGKPATVVITGYDARGAMYGVGKLLRSANWKSGAISIASDFHAEEAPDKPLRGHQIGYRDTANSWDAWSLDQFDAYFREMAIFGANSVENIPFHDARLPRVMKYTREEMNKKFGELCEKYDLEHWIWVPVEVMLPDDEKEAKFLQEQEVFYRSVKRLDAIFVPGGDPGNNKAIVLIPHLEKMAALARKSHPQVKVWLSLQHFKKDDVELTYNYLKEKKPDWFGGLVMGPGSPPMEATRKQLPQPYALRWYPDITHIVRCQYPVPWIDPVLGETIGREPVSPRPVDLTQIYQMDYGFTNGFLTYSDGVHDDFNKNLWSQLGWNPNRSARDIALDYARFFFSPDLAELGADGLFGLETNTRGAVADNGSITATYLLWQQLDKALPKPGNEWRFRMHVFRAYYDYYTRSRLLYEQDLEAKALESLKPVTVAKNPSTADVSAAIESARKILSTAQSKSVDPELRAKLDVIADQLFKEVGLQTSVPKYDASGYERGAVMDFVDYPLNNQWWIEDQFEQIAGIKEPAEQIRRLDIIRNWENPGEGGYYDVIGDVGRSPRIVKVTYAADMMRNVRKLVAPTQRWVGEKRLGIRQAWHAYLDEFVTPFTYNNLNPSEKYVVKLFAQRTSPLMIDGVKAKLIKTGDTFSQVTEQVFEVPADAVADGQIQLTWEALDERHLNWRQRHYVTDIWVMKASNLK